jgi:hypothetical protein
MIMYEGSQAKIDVLGASPSLRLAQCDRSGVTHTALQAAHSREKGLALSSGCVQPPLYQYLLLGATGGGLVSSVTSPRVPCHITSRTWIRNRMRSRGVKSTSSDYQPTTYNYLSITAMECSFGITGKHRHPN